MLSDAGNSPHTPRLAHEFAPGTNEAWRAAVDAVLARGAELTADELDERFARELVTTTVDGVTIQPLYTAEDPHRDPGLPGFAPFVRGRTALGGRLSGWDVRQRVLAVADAAATNAAVLHELSRGATSILLDLRRVGDVDAGFVRRCLDGVFVDAAPVALLGASPATGAALLDVLDERGPVAAGAVAAAGLGLDPISSFAEQLVPDPSASLAAAVDLAERCVRSMPGVRTFAVDGALAHECGGGEVEELGWAAAVGVELLRAMTAAGLEVDHAAAQLEFRFAATPDQFLTIAKLRAARRIWQRITAVAGVSAAGQGQVQHALTSTSTVARYDIWVNVLRSTVACFGAGVGGADAVTVLPHDELITAGGSALGRRLARNTQLVMIAESHLASVVDIAGGSFYVESLTDRLAEAGWAFLQEIEARGGALAALRAGDVQRRVAATASRRAAAVRRRRQPITGVTEFPDLADPPPPPTEPTATRAQRTAIEPLRRVRHAAEIEAQRARADRAASTSSRPTVFLATIGSPAAFSARATFAANLFAAGGIACVVGSGGVDPQAIAAEFVASAATLVCVCSADEVYRDHGVAVVDALRAAGAARVYLAGRPRGLDDELAAAGVDEQLVAGADIVDVAARALDTVGAP